MEFACEKFRTQYKFRSYPLLEDELKEKGGMFINCGYPNIQTIEVASGDGVSRPSSNMLFAIDLLNLVHSPIDYEMCLTVRMHID